MKRKTRGNGQGCAYRRGSSWTAQIVVGWHTGEDGNVWPIKRRKGGFSTKREALEYCLQLRDVSAPKARPTLQEVFDLWRAAYAPRVKPETMVCYDSAYKHFARLRDRRIAEITANDLQSCLDACPAGHRTHQNMKVTAGLIWAYALDSDLVLKDVTKNLYIGRGASVQREPLTEAEVEVIRAAIPSEPYAEYVYALCYLGFRPGEFLALKKSDYHEEGGVAYLVGGSKTEAGRGRRVPVPACIADIIARRLNTDGTEYLFPMRVLSRSGEFRGYKVMSDEYFRSYVFKPLMSRLGIASGKVPYSARHTYADKLKSIDGSDRAKAALMGHTDYAFTQRRYQSTELEDLEQIVKALE